MAPTVLHTNTTNCVCFGSVANEKKFCIFYEDFSKESVKIAQLTMHKRNASCSNFAPKQRNELGKFVCT